MDRARIEQQLGAWLEDTLALAEAGALPLAATIVPSVGGAAGTAPGTPSPELDAGLEGLELGRVLGAGGMGIVHAARQRVLGREVAVKMLREWKDGPHAIEGLLREARVMGVLEHPNVVPVYAVGADAAGRPQVVMRKIGGTTWAELMTDAEEVRRRFAAEDLLEWNLRILLQVMNAMRFAHSRRVLHRDLKPTNVMIGEFGEVYVLDWGLAVTLDDAEERLPRASAVRTLAGTPCYMAPEMLRPDVMPLSARTDVYLLGAVLFEVLAGDPPHRGDSAAEIARRVEQSAPEIPEDAPRELAAVCARALARDPAQRWDSVEAMERALRAFLDHRGSTEICSRALALVARLEDELGRASGEAGERQGLYQLFGQVRFGFREALAAWSGNDEATAGLIRAVEGMVRYELRHGDARAAEPLLAELDAPAPALVREVEEAVRRQEEELATIDRLRRRADRRLGGGQRRIFFLCIGGFFSVVPPAVTSVTGEPSFTYPLHYLMQGGFLTLWLLLGTLGRPWIQSTSLNRQTYLLVLAGILASLVLTTGYLLSGRTALETQVGHLFIFFVAGAVGAIVIERWLWPSGVVYCLAFLFGSVRPELSLHAMSASNLVLAANAYLIWRDQPGGPAPDCRDACES